MRWVKDKNVQMVVNELSNSDTKATSEPMLERADITSFAKKNTGTGMLYFIDAKSKKLISSISLSISNEEIMKAYIETIPKKHGDKGHVCDKSCKSKM